jgi:translation initiation factor 1A
LIGLREFGDEKADVIMKYYDEESKELKELGEIPEHIKINEGDFFGDEDGIEYVGAEEEKDDDDLDIDTI